MPFQQLNSPTFSLDPVFPSQGPIALCNYEKRSGHWRADAPIAESCLLEYIGDSGSNLASSSSSFLCPIRRV